ncbi:YceI family protein [Actinomadura sp. ATCC 31491]|uniref:YceI family protein n=1 Tax=Actinomadura luzonensis TaxID=2805427 RepID=A0ABT0G295_9ACTN|nr:YceI family protein [Actinomadura luzonensis]MCK2218221.1 YceI family protein [Actinomadura luzonensis]
MIHLPSTVEIPGYLAGTWKADPVHSEVAFTTARHGVRQARDGWTVDGELTLHGVTRQVPLAVEVNGFGADQWGAQRAGFSAMVEINRRDFGTPVEAGGVVVGDKVSISLEIQAVLQERGPVHDLNPAPAVRRRSSSSWRSWCASGGRRCSGGCLRPSAG